MMRAVQYEEYGPPSVLREVAVPRPTPAEGEVLVKVQASSVNGGELTKRKGRLRLITGRRFPQAIGIDFVGIVAALGEGVTSVPVGTAVWGTVSERSAAGTQAEYVAVPAARVALAPSDLSALEAATLIAGGTTALAALRDVAHLESGERLLVRGAAGGVGSVAVQVGRMLGARVTGLASPASADFVRHMGADDVINYRTPAADLGEFDVIFDTRGTELRAFRSRLAPTGRMITIAPDLDRVIPMVSYLALSAVRRKRRVRLFLGNPDAALLGDVAAAANSGALRPVVRAVFDLSAAADAHAALERGGVNGKFVLRIAP